MDFSPTEPLHELWRGEDMTPGKSSKAILLLAAAMVLLAYTPALPEGEILEIFCRSCGFRERFVQGSDAQEEARNIQNIIVVCERTGQIRNIKIPLNPDKPVVGEPLSAKQFGEGKSDLLEMKLPRFLVPGNTCPLFPVAAYLERNVCPVDGRPGLEFILVGRF
jgi:NAD-dependent SIR2 family protein deacetylase